MKNKRITTMSNGRADEGKITQEIRNLKLKEIFVGKADGLVEAKEKNFENYFYKGNNKYKELTEDRSKFIISGKKGTGKTILAKYYEVEQKKLGNPTKMLTDRDVVLREFMEKGKKDLDESETRLFIEFTILTELGKIICENKKKAYNIKNIFQWKKLYKSIKYIDSIVNHRTSSTNYLSDEYRIRNMEQEKATSNGTIKKDIVEAAAGYEVSQEHEIERAYRKNPFYNSLNELRDRVALVLKYMTVNLIFDDLDEYDDIITGNQKYINFFNSFIKVASAINTEILSNENHFSRIIIIRSDMLKPLNNSSKNLNKIIADGQIKLNWIKKVENGIHPLMGMIATKIRNSNILLRGLSDEDILKRFFPETINGIAFVNYMLNASFGRPRDIINMLNVIRNENREAQKFTAKRFIAAKQEYSELFLNELRNEMSSYYETDHINECFRIIEQINNVEFWLSDIECVMEKMAEDLQYFKSPKDFYELCYEFGIIGNVWNEMNKETGKDHKSYSWRYREDGSDVPDCEQKFCLHFALTKALIHR